MAHITLSDTRHFMGEYEESDRQKMIDKMENIKSELKGICVIDAHTLLDRVKDQIVVEAIF